MQMLGCRTLRKFTQTPTCRVLTFKRSQHYPAEAAKIDPALFQAFQANKAAKDDDTIRAVFDNMAFWKEFSNRTVITPQNATGIFDNPYLKTPAGVRQFAEVSLKQAQALTIKIVGDGASIQSLRDNIRNLDRLSDILCQVIDLVGFVRMSHPDQKFVQAAQEAHEVMYDFMNFLNTSVELYQMLDTVMGTKEIYNGLTDEEKVVGEILLADFKKSGIDLESAKQQEFINLSSQISVEGQKFMNNAMPKNQYVTFSGKKLSDLDGHMNLARRLGRVYVPTTGIEALTALKFVKDEEVRKEIWIEGRTAKSSQVKTLENFLDNRQKLANLMGKSNFAEYELDGKMIKSPGNVMKFLNGMADQVFPLAQAEIAQLRAIKNRATDIPNKTEEFQAWDRDYFGALYFQSLDTPDLSSISQYFSLGNVMQGLSRLFQNIYGIRFIPVETKPGEVWRDDIRRLDVVSETEGVIGVIYCDLFQRPGKSPNPAHFTIRCSRRIFDDENDDVRRLDPLANSATSVIKTASGEIYQLPIISLVCDFTRNTADGKCLLSFSEVETLFHEMGHAMHSMLGRTALHNVSGTRCATDFVELPSVLMENFASSPAVVSMFAKHHETNEPIPLELFEACRQTNQNFLRHSETYAQIKLAMLDQLYHDGQHGIDTMKTYYELEHNKGLFPAVSESMWPAQFTHLFGYGASYYCYLFDRAIADRIWEKCFSKNPVSREAGEHLKNQFLKWGGSKDPWKCVADVLGLPEIAKGDENAMRLITTRD